MLQVRPEQASFVPLMQVDPLKEKFGWSLCMRLGWWPGAGVGLLSDVEVEGNRARWRATHVGDGIDYARRCIVLGTVPRVGSMSVARSELEGCLRGRCQSPPLARSAR